MATKERRREWELEQEAKALQESRDNEYREAKRQWEDTIGAEIRRRWQPTIEEANRKVWDAKAIADAVDVAAAERDGKHKPGTIMVLWQKSQRWGTFEKEWQEAARGVVEVMKPDTVLPETMRWRPAAGTLLVRLLRKDGTPGKVVRQMRSYETWLPEGKKPK